MSSPPWGFWIHARTTLSQEKVVLWQQHGSSDFALLPAPLHAHLTLQRTAVSVFTQHLPQVGFEGRLYPKSAGGPDSSLHCCGTSQFRAPPSRGVRSSRCVLDTDPSHDQHEKLLLWAPLCWKIPLHLGDTSIL